MALISVSDGLKEVLDTNIDQIKGDYITLKLFADSAIREKLRRMGIAAGEDEIIAHLQKLEKARTRRLDKSVVKHTVTRHKKRVARARRALNEL